MSIKSQKTLYEECSEIIERSYSVRSYSDESLSCEEEEECLARELMNKMTPAVLSKLRRCFKKSKHKKRGVDIDRRVEEVMRKAAAEEGIEFAESEQSDDPLWLDEAAFVAAIENIFGHHKYTTHAHKLYSLLDPFGTGRVRWRQLVDRLVAVGAKKVQTRAEVWEPVGEVRGLKLEQCKRETIVKLVNIERSDSFCYVAVSQGGRAGVYSGMMQIIHAYEVFYHRTRTQRRVRNCWITDAVYLPDVQCLVYSASDRSLMIYDVVTLTHKPIYCITGLPNIPTCMAYTPAKRFGDCELALGTERGDITRIRFLQSKVSLLHTASNEQTNHYFWMELSSPPHTSYCSIHTWRRVHRRSVRRLAYVKDGEILASCSHDADVSVRLRHVPGKLNDYVFKVLRGVTCFHLVPSLRLLAAGGRDGALRLWESTQRAPYAALAAPAQAALLDVAVVAAKEIVLGYCSNCLLHIWDIYEECLLQTIKINFPFLGVLGKKAEFGAFCIHPGPVRKKVSEEDEQEAVDPPLLEAMTSRRGSSVYQGSTGGLILQDNDDDNTTGSLGEDREYSRFNRSELLLTCCDHVCILQLTPISTKCHDNTSPGDILPPPGDTLQARRPSFWDLPDDVFKEPVAPLTPEVQSTADSDAASLSSSIPASMLLSPSAAKYPLHDLETLLENAGLQGILEKDFVLMEGLKHDLYQKLAEMKDNMSAMTSALSMGAPYLALRCEDPPPVPPYNDMMNEYKRVMKLFPESSVAGTPEASNSNTSTTPRNKNSVETT